MKRCAAQKNAPAASEELMSPFVCMVPERRDAVFCPKPSRIIQISGGGPTKSTHRQLGQQVEPCDSKPGADVLDIILAKGTHGGGQVASSPPFFSGSPPSRSANPLVHDARFVEDAAAPPPPLPPLTVSAASPSAGGRKGCVRKSFGPNPAAVRIEGFDCLDPDGRRGSCSITAVA